MNGLVFAALLLFQSTVPSLVPPSGQAGRPSRGVVVTGRVVPTHGAFQPAFVQTVTLSREPALSTEPSTNSIADADAFEVPVRTDGTFEFRSVGPGRYALRTLPLMPGMSPVSVDVRRVNVRDLKVSVPFQMEVSGRIANLGPAPVRPVVMADLGKFTMSTIVLEDNTFTLRLSEGENRIAVSRLPAGFVVKSITFGDIDITRSPLTVSHATIGKKILITLEPDLPENLPVITAKTAVLP
jgi:hypothetical protein